MKKHRLAFIDTETTGFDPITQEVIEIGVVIAEQSDNGETLKMIEEFELKIKPEHIETADAQALRVNGYDPSAWLFALALPEAMKVFAEKTADCIFVAHNLTFDYAFINEAFRKTGIENKMHYPKIDTISFAYAKLHKKTDIDKFNLHELATYFGVQNQNAHTALADARTLFQIYQKMVKE